MNLRKSKSYIKILLAFTSLLSYSCGNNNDVILSLDSSSIKSNNNYIGKNIAVGSETQKTLTNINKTITAQINTDIKIDIKKWIPNIREITKTTGLNSAELQYNTDHTISAKSLEAKKVAAKIEGKTNQERKFEINITFQFIKTKIIFVNKNTPERNKARQDGSSWQKAFSSLSRAIYEITQKKPSSTNKFQIWIAKGTYLPERQGAVQTETPDMRLNHFTLKNNLSIIGGFQGNENYSERPKEEINKTILSGDIGMQDNDSDNAYHVFFHPRGTNLDETAILESVTIEKGRADSNAPYDDGGGMFNISSSPALTNVTFKSNKVNNKGGGIYNIFSSPKLTNVTFKNNKANDGGGMNNFSSSPALTNVTFKNNKANHKGGGIYNIFSSPALTNVTFKSNKAKFVGGGMNNFSSSPTLNDVTFKSNEAEYSGGMNNEASSSPALTNVTFKNNKAKYSGGGMSNISSPTSLTNVTFTNNRAQKGGGMYNYNSSSTIINSIFWGNTADESGNQIYNDRGTPRIAYSIIEGYTESSKSSFGTILAGVTGLDPKLSSLGSHGGFLETIPLLDDSNAINRGTYVKKSGNDLYYSIDNTTWYKMSNSTTVVSPPADAIDITSKDARGFLRVGRPDMGAYEFGGIAP